MAKNYNKIPGNVSLNPGQTVRLKMDGSGWEGIMVPTSKNQIGLSNVDNTKDIDKVVSNATKAELDKKADISALKEVALTASYNDLLDVPELPEIPTLPELAEVALSGSYDDLTNTPTIPVVPQLSTVATSGSYADLNNKPVIPTLPTLSSVATSGSYSDLTNKPTIPVVPALATVATSGKYTDLTNKPTIKRQETYLGNTNASGNYTVVYPTPYATTPDVQPQLQNGTPSQVVRITATSTTGFTVQVTNRASATVLGIELLLAATTVVASSPVSVLVTERV